MGLKRSFDEEFPEFSFKHSRLEENGNRLSSFGENVASDTLHKCEFEDGFHKLQWSDSHVDDFGSELSKCADNDIETSAPFSWVTSSSSEDDTGLGPTASSSLSPEYYESDFPRREVVSFDDIYSSFSPRSPRSPRKQVAIGLNHQAILPFCVRDIHKDNSDQTGKYSSNPPSHRVESDNCVNDGYEERLMGTCIIPMPNFNLSAPDGDNAGVGRRDCTCLDVGSLRCVRQHILEAQERLRNTLGQEKFLSLGFRNMGEEVASKWSEEEEHVFHEVVYSNPGKSFWKNLAAMFPSRTKGEIVSYYFNIFMLRRRAAQNRSKVLDIDSDDDEWHESNGGSYVVKVNEDQDFRIETPIRDDQDEYEVGSPEEEEEEEDDYDDNNDGTDNDDEDDESGTSALGGYGREDPTVDYLSGALGNGRFDSVTQHLDETPRSYTESFDVQDNSCVSFECSTAKSSGGGYSAEVAGLKNNYHKSLFSMVDGSSEGLGLIYMLEPCDAKGWDVRYPTDPVKSVDLLPTCNMIDEIFGQGTWDNKKMDD